MTDAAQWESAAASALRGFTGPNGFHLFRCTDRGDGVLGPLDALEVDSAFWVAEQDFDAQNWRFPAQVQDLREFLQR